MTKKMTVCSLFAGIGGMDLAFEQAGFEIKWANEIDKYACRTYRLNFPNTQLVEGDIRDISESQIPPCDLLVAGFPCQAFSSVGLKKGFEDEQGNVFFEIVRILRAHRAPTVFFENVSNLIKHDSGNTLKTIFGLLEDLGYHLAYKIMNASDYGIPQQRNRIYIVGSQSKGFIDDFAFPEPFPLKHDAFYFLDKDQKDPSYYLNRLKFFEEVDEAVKDDDRIYRFTDWGISSGRKGICPTLLAAMGSAFPRIPFFRDAYSIRKITQREAARLQGFPEEFQFDFKAPKQVYKQIGNSVCVPIVNSIAKLIYQKLKKESKDERLRQKQRARVEICQD